MNTHDNPVTVWRLTPHHECPQDALEWTKKAGRIAIGWGDIGDIKVNGYTSPQAIAEAVKKHFPGKRNAPRYEYSLYGFCYHMRVGDLVIIKFKNTCHVVMEVEGDYEYKPTSEEPPLGNYQHQRKAKVLSINPTELWRHVGGIGRRSPYPPLVECLKALDADAKTTLTLGYSDNTQHKTMPLPTEDYISADEVDSNAVYQEGAVRHVVVNTYERSPKARQQCITLHGRVCCVCDFDFGKFYGDAGFGYIQVHHLRPLADIREQYEVDPATELRPVCANCHAVIHRRTPPYNIEDMKAMLK